MSRCGVRWPAVCGIDGNIVINTSSCCAVGANLVFARPQANHAPHGVHDAGFAGGRRQASPLRALRPRSQTKSEFSYSAIPRGTRLRCIRPYDRASAIDAVRMMGDLLPAVARFPGLRCATNYPSYTPAPYAQEFGSGVL